MACRALMFALPLALLSGLVLAPVALGDAITPESGGSPNADDIDTLYKYVLAVAVVVFVGVEGALLYSVIRFRQRRGKKQVAAQIHGNTRLEIGWTVGAAVIVLILTVLAFLKLDSINDPAETGSSGLVRAQEGVIVASVDQPPPPGDKGLTIDVNGQQYLWRYLYPNGAYSYDEMVVPTNTTVILKIRSQDVAHSWWIPQLGGKFDAIPGYTNKTWFKIADEGTYDGQCAELCGNGHANMVAKVTAVSPESYRAWVACQKQLINTAQQLTQPAKRNSPTPPPPAVCRDRI